MQLWLLEQQCLLFFPGSDWERYLCRYLPFFFPIEIAIALTAVVHLANNLFKMSLIWKSISKTVFLLFAIPAMLTAYFGARLLEIVSREIIIFSYSIAGSEYEVTLLRLIISALLITFAIFELSRFERVSMKKKYLPIGGLLSGFFGGLSGHQGALRSMFLLRAGLNKERFIATGIAAATMIDISRLTVYGTSFFADYLDGIDDKSSLLMLATAILAAFAGSLTGRKLLRKITMKVVRLIVGFMILILAVLMGAGII